MSVIINLEMHLIGTHTRRWADSFHLEWNFKVKSQRVFQKVSGRNLLLCIWQTSSSVDLIFAFYCFAHSARYISSFFTFVFYKQTSSTAKFCTNLPIHHIPFFSPKKNPTSFWILARLVVFNMEYNDIKWHIWLMPVSLPSVNMCNTRKNNCWKWKLKF